MHDLNALENIILKDSRFVSMVNDRFPSDSKRGGFNKDYRISQAWVGVQKALENDNEYEHEYIQFAASMSFQPDDQRATFSDAVESLSRIGNYFELGARSTAVKLIIYQEQPKRLEF